MIRFGAVVLLLVLLPLLDCSLRAQKTPQQVASACPAPDLVTSNWPYVSNRVFSLRIPPGHREVEVKGADSYAGGFEAGDSAGMGFDYGHYSARLEEEGRRPEADTCWDRVDGIPVYVVSWVHDSTFHGSTWYCAGGSWRPEESRRSRLTLTGCATSVEGQRQVLAVLP